MCDLTFINNPECFYSYDELVIHLSGINSKSDLFDQMSDKLKLPDYFGRNWDALYDCLRDLHWIEYHKVILVHDEPLLLNEYDLSKYLEVLLDAVHDWKEAEEHSLEIIFPEYLRDLVVKHLKH